MILFLLLFMLVCLYTSWYINPAALPMGTRSLLFGAHTFYRHPYYVARAWKQKHGAYPRHPAIWLSILVHDWGYWGCPNMDGKEGSRHPELGAKIVEFFFGRKWADFCLFHSRTYAQMHGREPSELAYVDKLAFTVQNKAWYCRAVKRTGEYLEYFENADAYNRKRGECMIRCSCLSDWYDDLVTHFYQVIK